MASSFVPKGKEELLLRTPLTFGFSAPTNMYQPRSGSASAGNREDGADGSREEQQSRMRKLTRNTPHTARLKSMKGLGNGPICAVEDNQKQPRPMSALSNRDLGSGYRPPGSSRYAANANKELFAVGVVPVTYAWRDELIRKAEKAINKALGRDPSSSSSSRAAMGSRKSSRGLPKQFDHLDDKSLLDMMCQILHTQSIPACQEWLNNAPENEKDIVLNMIRLATLGGPEAEKTHTRPPTRDYRYVWKPDHSRRYSDPCLPEDLDLLSLNIHPRYLFKQGAGGGGGGGIRFPGIAQKGAERESLEGKRGRKAGGGGGGRGRRESEGVTEKQSRMRSVSHDTNTQTDQQSVGDLYRTIAGQSVLKMSEQKLRGAMQSKRQRHCSHEKSLSREKTNTLPPIHFGHDKQQQCRPRSKSASVAPSHEHRVTGERREEEGRRRRSRRGSELQYTSHWKDQ